MKKIKLLPLEGIEIENIGKVELGKSKSEIERLLGRSTRKSNNNELFYEEYDDYGIRFWFDKHNYVEYIEIYNGPFPKEIIVSIYGVNPFQMFATNLVEFLTERNNGLMIGNATRNSYSFLNISVGLWRRVSEKSIEIDIDESKANGTYEEIKEMVEQDLKIVNYFSSIGVGIRKFYKINY
jgi:hypothetical protein